MVFALKKQSFFEKQQQIIEIKIRGEIEDLTILKKLEKKERKKKKKKEKKKE